MLLASGHFRNGILLAPVTAEGIAAELAGGDPIEELKVADPGRFRLAVVR